MAQRQGPVTRVKWWECMANESTPRSVPGPSCMPQTPHQNELTLTLVKLRQEKLELEAILAGEVCTLDPVKRDLENSKKKFEDITNTIQSLKVTKNDMESEILRLEEKAMERTKALETLTLRVDTVKTKLHEAVGQATKELQHETQGRISAQENFVSAQLNLQQCSMLGPENNIVEDDRPYAYPYDATVERPARYVRSYLRRNPPAKVPFPNDAMDEAEALGHETQ